MSTRLLTYTIFLLFLLTAACATDGLYQSPLGIKFEIPAGWAVVDRAVLLDRINRETGNPAHSAMSDQDKLFTQFITKQNRLEFLTRDGRLPARRTMDTEFIMMIRFPFSFQLDESQPEMSKLLCTQMAKGRPKQSCVVTNIGGRSVLKIRNLDPAVDISLAEVVFVPVSNGSSVAIFAGNMNKPNIYSAVQIIITSMRAARTD